MRRLWRRGNRGQVSRPILFCLLDVVGAGVLPTLLMRATGLGYGFWTIASIWRGEGGRCYAPHADIVNGTRTVEQLRQFPTQLTTFMYYGNVFVGKLLEARHLGKATITDVGTTYKLCRRSALEQLLPRLNPAVDLEFNAHFLDMAIREGLRVVECPITFHPRVGTSKGGNVSDVRALRVGLRMISGIIFGWPERA